jgi:type IV pilus biogenesis protein CpaD/CtpE
MEMKITRYALLGVTVAMSLAGCETMSEPAEPTLAPNFGNAVKANMAAHIVNPEAGKKEQPAPPLDGQKAERVIKDYRQETGEAPTGTLIEDVGG